MIGALKVLVPVAILIGLAAIVSSITADIVNSMQVDQVSGATGCNATARTNCSYAYNISTYGMQGIDEQASWYDTIGLVIAAAVVIAILVGVLGTAAIMR